MIDEIPEKKQPVIKREIPKRDRIKETRVDIETYEEFEGGLSPHVKKDVVKVGRLNISDDEKPPRESDRPKTHQMVRYFSHNFRNMVARFYVSSRVIENCSSCNYIG